MAKKDSNRSSEQRYYVTANEAAVIERAAQLAGKGKSDYCRDVLVPRATRALLAAGLDVPLEVRHLTERLDIEEGITPSAPAKRPGDEEQRLLDAFDAIREIILRRKI